MTFRDDGKFPRRLGVSAVQSLLPSVVGGTVLGRPYHLVLIAFLSAANLVPIWIDTYFPSQNGPWCLLTAHMLHEVDNPQFNYSENFDVHWHPIPYLAHTGLLYLLGFLLPLMVANKVALSIYVVAFPLSIFYFLASIDRTKLVWGYLGFLCVLNWPFFRGYHNYCLGLPIFFFTFGYWYQHHRQWTLPRMAWMMTLATLCYFSHLFIVLMLGFTLTLCYLHESRNVGGYLRNVIVPLIPSGLLFLEFVWLNLTSAVWIDSSELIFLPVHTAAESFFRKFFYTFSFVAYLTALVPLALLSLLWWKKLVECVKILRRDGPRKLLGDQFLALWLALLLLYFLLPYKFMGWHYVNSRAVPFVLIFGILVTSTPGQAWFRSLFITTVSVATLVVAAVTSYEIVRVNDHIEEFLAGTSQIEHNKRLLPILLENEKFGGELRPLTRVYEYYQVKTGGVNNNSWGQFNTVTPVWYRTYPIEETFPSYDGADPQGSLKRIRDAYDYVLFWGQDEQLFETFRDGGFTPHYEHRRLTIYRNSSLPDQASERNDPAGGGS